MRSENSDPTRNPRRPPRGVWIYREPSVNHRQEIEVGQPVQDETTQMVVCTSKDEVASPQQFRGCRVCQRGLPNGNFRSETHPVNMVFEYLHLGPTPFEITSSRSMKTVQIRFVDDIRIDQEQLAHSSPRQQNDDCTTSSTATDDPDAQLLKPLHRFCTDCQRLSLQEFWAGSYFASIDWRTRINHLRSNDPHPYRLWSSVGAPDTRLYLTLTAKEETDQHLVWVPIAAPQQVAKMAFVVIVLWRERCPSTGWLWQMPGCSASSRALRSSLT